MTKLWVDDLRPPPDNTWHWATTSDEAVQLLQDKCISELSLDHDLGGDDTTRPVVMFMCNEEVWPPIIRCHSMNPVGRHWVVSMINRYKP